MDGSSKASGSRQNASSAASFTNTRLSTTVSSGTTSDQAISVAGSKTGSPRAKTWANIAGQPPKGSAAVLHNSNWSAKRGPGHSYEPNSNRSSTAASSYPFSKNFTSVSVKSNHPEKPTSEERTSFCPTGETQSGENKVNSTNTAKATLNSTDESMLALQRESEALHQKLSEVINPTKFDTHIEKARFFVIKSFSEDDIHRSIKYSIWCSTELGNKKLDAAFADANHNFPIYLFFSVNGSGHFCGMAEMTSRVDYNARANVWAQDKWQGKFSVRWIFVKDVPNTALRHIRIETNENKPVTHSRDTTELPLERGRQVVQVFANYSHTLSIFDDFLFYEQRERQEGSRKKDFGNRRG